MNYTAKEVAKVLADRTNQAHFIEWMIEQCAAAERARADAAEQDAKDYRAILATIVSEHPKHNQRSPDGPGHCHGRPGIWDSDNGVLAGQPCAWCMTWRLAVAATESVQSTEARQ